MDAPLVDVAAFDTLGPDAASELLRPSCASSEWLQAMVAGRPYGTLAAVAERSDAVLGELEPHGLDEALAAHPRIGDRPAGDRRESAWSRQEQAQAADAGGEVAQRLRAGNVAYEERFGQVFLICATGRTSEEILAGLTERLGHDLATEQQVVRRELAAIVRLRLERTLR
jgi:2-oxo-4-hydroxy-4-carboxy-5-ureidoimidazoline decarboxylase